MAIRLLNTQVIERRTPEIGGETPAEKVTYYRYTVENDHGHTVVFDAAKELNDRQIIREARKRKCCRALN